LMTHVEFSDFLLPCEAPREDNNGIELIRQSTNKSDSCSIWQPVEFGAIA
jgi:hypothetical protein